jgi:hypothetical protein
VLLSYRMPREPSTPRIAVWRKLKRMGIAQLPAALVQERDLAAGMAAARVEEYRSVIAQATDSLAAEETARAATARKLRGELRRIARRDYFPPPECDQARAAVQGLLDQAVAEQEAAAEQREEQPWGGRPAHPSISTGQGPGMCQKGS